MKPSTSLRRHIGRVLDVIARYPMTKPRLFGSTARGEDTEQSDLDILVDLNGHPSLYDLADLEMELESILDCKVQIITLGDLAPDVAERVAPDLRPMA
jgi:predicted nucleotidyltransferase